MKKLPFRADSLLIRLIFFGVLLVILGAVLRYFFFTALLRNNLIQVFSAQQSSLAQVVAGEVNDKIGERRHLLERLAHAMSPELLTDPARLNIWLNGRQLVEPLFSLGLLVADRQGRIVADAPTIPGRVGMQVIEMSSFHDALTGHFVIGHPLVGPATKQPLLSMMAPVRDATGRVRAVLIGLTSLSAAGFLDLQQRKSALHAEGFLLVSPQDKLFVASSDPSMIFTPTPAPGVNPLHDRAMQGFRGSGVTVNAKGVEEISGIASVPSTGWFVVAHLPTSVALASIQPIRRVIVWSGFAAIALVILSVGLSVTWLLRPLHRAAEQARRMTRGELPLKPLPVVRDDEVGQMTQAFNRLLAKLETSQAELKRLAHLDMLTGLPNRSLLAERLPRALARAARTRTLVALLFLDLDGFKPINDTLGHDAGDDALKEIARRLTAVVRQNDTLARVGGDEFVLVAGDFAAPAEDAAQQLAQKCIDAVAQPLLLKGRECSLSVSVGIALCDGNFDADRLLAAADNMMYQAKRLGRGSYMLEPNTVRHAPAAATTS
ncbi:diguanylate cyclase [Pandoraea sp.]|uniref:diguanylate cyclase domain-containing protein n=1 Tax=Pandoraea sp. TaxID=1883445 RepID=UPI0025F1DC5D|nr:diguanylate cyclase [Pandoraea sp.]